MQFTKEEMGLCEQIAEKHRKQLKLGDWMVVNYILTKEQVTLFDTKWGECPNRFTGSRAVYNASNDRYYKEYVPLWTISDCLEFLREKYAHVDIHTQPETHGCFIGQSGEQGIIQWHDSFWANSPLEACLKAVLAVLEEATE